MNYFTKPKQGLKGEISVAPDKSISHRALILSAIAQGDSVIKNLLLSDDVLRTLTILNQLGVQTSHDATSISQAEELVVHGQGFFGLKPPEDVLYCGNSGTTMRLLMGLLAGQPFESILTGDASLNLRPMDRVMDPLKEMGAEFEEETRDGKRFIRVLPGSEKGISKLKGIDYHMPIASAQVKTALLLAGLFAEGETQITEPCLSRNHTELLLKAMRARVKCDKLNIVLNPVKKLKPLNMIVPGDVSSAAFFIVAALLTRDSDLVIKNVNLNPTRTGLIDVLRYMGANISIENKELVQKEEIGSIRVRSSQLKNISISGNLIPKLIDEIPALALAAAQSHGKMVVAGAKELRVKETDRIKAICSELQKIGVKIQEREDGFLIEGQPRELIMQQETVTFNSFGDHRMAMMEAVAGLLLDRPAVIDDVDCVKTSFPGFFELIDNF